MAHITKTVTNNPINLLADAPSSFITTTGDLTFQSTTGSLILRGDEAVANAVQIIALNGGIDMNAAGVLSINSSGGIINIGNDAVAQNMNIGTGAAARTIAIGNTTTTTSVNIDAGPTGFITLNEIIIDVNEDVTGMHDVTLDPGGVYALQGGTSGTVTIDTLPVAGTWSLTLPNSGGTNNFVLRTDGSGNTTWVAQTGGVGGLPIGYLDGMTLEWNSVTQVQIAAGTCRDSTDAFDLTLASATTITVTSTGAGGRQTGTSDTTSTWWKCLVIGDTTESNATTTLLVPQLTAFSQTGYDVFRLIGHVRNNGAGNFNRFTTHGKTRSRRVTQEETRTLMTMFDGFHGGTDLTFQTLDISAFVPDNTSMIDLQYSYDLDGDADKLFLSSGINNQTISATHGSNEVIVTLGSGNTTGVGDFLDYLVHNFAIDPSGPSFDWAVPDTANNGNETRFVLVAYIQDI